MQDHILLAIGATTWYYYINLIFMFSVHLGYQYGLSLYLEEVNGCNNVRAEMLVY